MVQIQRLSANSEQVHVLDRVVPSGGGASLIYDKTCVAMLW